MSVPPRVPGGRRGFVLAFVVFMLFAVSVAAATGYLVVSSEFSMAKNSSDSAEALAVARAGLERFVAEEIGVVGDSVSYALGDGVALITTRKLFAQDSVTDVYYIRSEGTVADIFAPNTPATRVVGGYAIHRRRPLAHHAALMISSDSITALSFADIDGYDETVATDCPGGGTVGITGAIARIGVGQDADSDVRGFPRDEAWGGDYTQFVDSIGLRWDVLRDPDFPVEFDGVLPNYASLPADSFPVVRLYGWQSVNSPGRGVLIIDGTFDGAPGFVWDGIIIARDVDDYIEGTLNGLLVGGLDANNSYPVVWWWDGDVSYNSCNVYAANESLSYLELIENTVFESY